MYILLELQYLVIKDQLSPQCLCLNAQTALKLPAINGPRPDLA